MNYQNKISIHLLLFIMFLTGTLLGSVAPAKAQLDAQISQHMFNRTYYNPAATGVSDYINAFVLARKQWVGWDGAPETQLASVHGYVHGMHSGLGLNFINDKLGFEKVQTIQAMYAYHLFLGTDTYLSMGLGGGVQNQSLDYTQQNPVDINDPNLTWDMESKWNPDFSFGLEYNYKRFKIGGSITHLGQAPDKDNPLTPGMHYYGYVRYTIPVSFDWTLVPSFFTQHSIRSTHLEAGALAYFREQFWLGSFFRMDDKVDAESLVLMAGVHIAKYFRIGYAFDYNLKYLSGYTQNTHEVFLSLQIPYKAGKYSKTPRFFE